MRTARRPTTKGRLRPRVGEHPIGNRAVATEKESNPRRMATAIARGTAAGTGRALARGPFARVAWPEAMRTPKRTRSARNKAEHAARIARERPDVAARGAKAADPLDEAPMAAKRPSLAPIPWNKASLTDEQRQAVSQAILDHYPGSEIARALGIAVRTLRRLIDEDPELTDAADSAKDQEEAELRDALMAMARQGSEVAALFLLKSRHGYIDRPDPKVNANEGFRGGVLLAPMAMDEADFDAMVFKQQAQYRERREDAPGKDPFAPDRRTSTDQGHGVVMQRPRAKDMTRH
jgi:hypothetical protein